MVGKKKNDPTKTILDNWKKYELIISLLKKNKIKIDDFDKKILSGKYTKTVVDFIIKNIDKFSKITKEEFLILFDYVLNYIYYPTTARPIKKTKGQVMRRRRENGYGSSKIMNLRILLSFANKRVLLDSSCIDLFLNIDPKKLYKSEYDINLDSRFINDIYYNGHKNLFTMDHKIRFLDRGINFIEEDNYPIEHLEKLIEVGSDEIDPNNIIVKNIKRYPKKNTKFIKLYISKYLKNKKTTNIPREFAIIKNTFPELDITETYELFPKRLEFKLLLFTNKKVSYDEFITKSADIISTITNNKNKKLDNKDKCVFNLDPKGFNENLLNIIIKYESHSNYDDIFDILFDNNCIDFNEKNKWIFTLGYSTNVKYFEILFKTIKLNENDIRNIYRTSSTDIIYYLCTQKILPTIERVKNICDNTKLMEIIENPLITDSNIYQFAEKIKTQEIIKYNDGDYDYEERRYEHLKKKYEKKNLCKKIRHFIDYFDHDDRIRLKSLEDKILTFNHVVALDINLNETLISMLLHNGYDRLLFDLYCTFPKYKYLEEHFNIYRIMKIDNSHMRRFYYDLFVDKINSDISDIHDDIKYYFDFDQYHDLLSDLKKKIEKDMSNVKPKPVKKKRRYYGWTRRERKIVRKKKKEDDTIINKYKDFIDGLNNDILKNFIDSDNSSITDNDDSEYIFKKKTL